MKKIFIWLFIASPITAMHLKESTQAVFRKINNASKSKFYYFQELPVDIQSYILEFVIIDLLHKYNNNPKKFFIEFRKLFANQSIEKILRTFIPKKPSITRLRGKSPPNNIIKYLYISEIAAINNSKKLLNLVLKNNIKLNIEEINRLLILAVITKNEEFINWLIKKNADVNFVHPDVKTLTPLISSCLTGNYKITELLIQNNALVNNSAYEGYRINNYLLSKIGRISQRGNSPLTAAVRKNKIDIVELLISHKVNLNEHSKDGNTALMFAAKKGFFAILNLLLKSGADIKLKNYFQEDALIVAYKAEHLNIVQILLDTIIKGKIV